MEVSIAKKIRTLRGDFFSLKSQMPYKPYIVENVVPSLSRSRSFPFFLMLGQLVPAALASEMLAGFLGGASKTLAFYPLDALTTLRELRQPLWTPSPAAAAAGDSSTSAHAVLGSLSRYYSGCGVAIAGLLPYAMIFHAAFWACERSLATLSLALVLPLAVRQASFSLLLTHLTASKATLRHVP